MEALVFALPHNLSHQVWCLCPLVHHLLPRKSMWAIQCWGCFLQCPFECRLTLLFGLSDLGFHHVLSSKWHLSNKMHAYCGHCSSITHVFKNVIVGSGIFYKNIKNCCDSLHFNSNPQAVSVFNCFQLCLLHRIYFLCQSSFRMFLSDQIRYCTDRKLNTLFIQHDRS